MCAEDWLNRISQNRISQNLEKKSNNNMKNFKAALQTFNVNYRKPT